MLEDLVLHMNF